VPFVPLLTPARAIRTTPCGWRAAGPSITRRTQRPRPPLRRRGGAAA